MPPRLKRTPGAPRDRAGPAAPAHLLQHFVGRRLHGLAGRALHRAVRAAGRLATPGCDSGQGRRQERRRQGWQGRFARQGARLLL
jgi:hypothetical protein